MDRDMGLALFREHVYTEHPTLRDNLVSGLLVMVEHQRYVLYDHAKVMPWKLKLKQKAPRALRCDTITFFASPIIYVIANTLPRNLPT